MPGRTGMGRAGRYGSRHVLSAYQVAATSRRRSWRLLQLILLNGEPRPVVFGYSTHLTHDLLIADRSVNHGEAGLIVETSSIYTATF